MTVTDETTQPRPLPPLQGDMAALIEGGAVWYSRQTGRWYIGPEGHDREVRGPEGRALRTMLVEELVEATGDQDGRRAQRVVLTEAGRARVSAI